MIAKFFLSHPAAHQLLVVAYAIVFGAAALVADHNVAESYDPAIALGAVLLTCAASLATYAWILRDKR